MPIANLVLEIDAEIARLQQVKRLLSDTSRPLSKVVHTNDGAERKKRVLSPAARRNIAKAQKKRWAAQKKAAAQKA